MSKTEKKKQQQRDNDKNSTPLLIGGIAAVLIVAVGLFIALGGWPVSQPVESGNSTATPNPGATEYAYVPSPILLSGNSTAPATLTLFEDFHCSACAYFNREMIQQVEERYVSTGELRIFFRHFVHYGDDSLVAAEAAECVHEQDVEYRTDKFRPFHNLLFENQRQPLEPRLSEFASQVGVQDLAAFENCVASGKYAEKIRESTAWITGQGARGTPAIIVGDRIYTGVPSMDALEQGIAEQLQHLDL